MPVATRLALFEEWSRERGLVARDVDRRRVARELLELAADRPVHEDHIETLTKRYRDGLMGARSVLAARRVAQELLEWQDEAGPAIGDPVEKEAQRPGPTYDEDLEEEAADDALELVPPPRAPPPARGGAISSFPPPGGDGWPLDEPLARSERPRAPSQRPAARSDRAPPSSERPSPRSDRAPPRPYPSDVMPWPARLDGADRDAARHGLPSRRPEEPYDPEATPLVPPVSDNGGPRSTSDRAGPSRRSQEMLEPSRSARPPAPSRRPSALDEEPRRSVRPSPSRRPLADDDDAFNLDDQPKRFKAGFSKPPSIRAPAHGLPELERAPGDVDAERKLRARDEIEDNVAPPPPTADGRRLSERPSLNLPPMLELPPGPEPRGRRALVILGALLAVMLAVLLIARPGCVFASGNKRIAAGTFVSRHLGLAWEFPESWLQDQRLDDTESSQPGWKRKVSVFYHGSSANAFQNQFVVVVFEKDGGAPATEDDARQLGANEVITASRRHCDAVKLRSVVATRCVALAARPGQPLGVIETSFVLDGRAILLRFQHELPLPTAGTPEEAEQQAEMLQLRMATQLINADKVAMSVRTLR